MQDFMGLSVSDPSRSDDITIQQQPVEDSKAKVAGCQYPATLPNQLNTLSERTGITLITSNSDRSRWLAQMIDPIPVWQVHSLREFVEFHRKKLLGTGPVVIDEALCGGNVIETIHEIRVTTNLPVIALLSTTSIHDTLVTASSAADGILIWPTMSSIDIFDVLDDATLSEHSN